jgi:hypothetical protein
VLDPQSGRFLQTDPVGYKDDNDLYAYVHDDPLDGTDPTGEIDKTPGPGQVCNDFGCYTPATEQDRKNQDKEHAQRNKESVEDAKFFAKVEGTVIVAAAACAEICPALVAEAPEEAAAAEEGAAEEGSAARRPRSRCCFVAGTLVETKSGLRPIEAIAVGDFVLSRDATTGESAFKPVIELIHRHDRETYVLTLETVEGSSFHKSTFETTGDHPWRTVFDKWVQTIDLRSGDLLQRARGTSARVVSVRKTGRTAPTFNLEVAEFHTYFVGAEGIWVHNEDCGEPHENHHIKPKYLGGAKNGPTARIPRSYHQKITSAFRRLWSYGKGAPSAEQVEKIMKEVYDQFPLPK